MQKIRQTHTGFVKSERNIYEDKKPEESKKWPRSVLLHLVTIMRILFGVGWLSAGVSKVTGEGWFTQPGKFLHSYLEHALTLPQVPGFYKFFIEHVVLEHLLLFNYVIPITQIILGLFLIFGFLIVPSVMLCLFMHVNFILSGNMNLISLVLYTTAFGILLSQDRIYQWSLDQYWGFSRKKSIRLPTVHQ
ncbi:TQO small subunit DoxD [Desmospora profundinema]|uniref:Thiosulfate dehydrogenase [quinone] large subunit n=1 Tax=Desmospora profundinema TaxID=1571184 RepID=A0ABU1IP92_9BACL|nr:TQO small subunit DoxD [Desmospora profundinema]MDR6226342.1 thiosulfate dehydrogenase [quinone] large subunit [Desmospora profundinema]